MLYQFTTANMLFSHSEWLLLKKVLLARQYLEDQMYYLLGLCVLAFDHRCLSISETYSIDCVMSKRRKVAYLRLYRFSTSQAHSLNTEQSGNRMRLFDVHCHLQDPRVLNVAPQLIQQSLDTGVLHFAVNGVSEKDWHLVKQMSDSYPSVVPCFGLHPWFIRERSPTWFTTLRQYLNANPTSSIGEIGLDKGSHGKQIDFTDQVEVFRQQLELARDINKPASIHCVRAFGDLLETMKSVGPFPAGVILHSFLGSPEMVPDLAKLGAYFSFSGFLMSMKLQKAKKLVKAVPLDRILLETDAPDALPSSDLSSLFLVEGDPSIPQAPEAQGTDPSSDKAESKLGMPKGMLNHPANIHSVLVYVASLLEKSKEEVAEMSCSNAFRLFSYEGSKIPKQD